MFHLVQPHIMNEEKCTWIGDGENCQKDAVSGRSYCERHHNRMYIVLLPEMADYIIEKELKESGFIPKSS